MAKSKDRPRKERKTSKVEGRLFRDRKRGNRARRKRTLFGLNVDLSRI